MIRFMKLALIIISAVGVLSSGCKLETSSATPNSNVNASANQTANLNTPAEPASSNCQLSMAGAPNIKGLKLGMTLDEVLALFPGSKDDEEVRKHLSQPPSQF